MSKFKILCLITKTKVYQITRRKKEKILVYSEKISIYYRNNKKIKIKSFLETKE